MDGSNVPIVACFSVVVGRRDRIVKREPFHDQWFAIAPAALELRVGFEGLQLDFDINESPAFVCWKPPGLFRPSIASRKCRNVWKISTENRFQSAIAESRHISLMMLANRHFASSTRSDDPICFIRSSSRFFSRSRKSAHTSSLNSWEPRSADRL